VTDSTPSSAAEWRRVPGFPPEFEVSSEGLIRRWKKRGPYYYTQKSDRSGYLRVFLSPRRHFVHRIVLSAFAGECPPGHEGGHLNGIKTDNRISNLAWVTRLENNRHKQIHGTEHRGSKRVNAKLSESDIPTMFQLRRQGVGVKRLAKRFGVCRRQISQIFAGTAWAHVSREGL
jgi:hypothetical protein